MAGMGVHRALSRGPLAASYRAKFFVAVALGSLAAPAALALWIVTAGTEVPHGVYWLVLSAAVTGAVAAGLLVHALLAPVVRAAEAAQAALEGRSLPPIPDLAKDDLAGRLLSDVTRLASGEASLGRSRPLASVTDPLTGLRNRHWCETRLAEELGAGTRARNPFVLALINVDQLRHINDHHGHAAGDACLRRVAEVTGEALRTGDWVARWGGDEFVAVLRGGRGEAQAALERLRERLLETPVTDGGSGEVRVRVKIGAVAAGGDEGADALFRSADRAVVAARREGRDRVVFFGD